MPITLSTAQLKAIDNEHASITKDEIKSITALFIELDASRQVHAKDIDMIAVLGRIIRDKDQVIELKDQTIDLVNRRLDIVTPAWYDKFVWGYALGVVSTIIVLFLAN